MGRTQKTGKRINTRPRDPIARVWGLDYVRLGEEPTQKHVLAVFTLRGSRVRSTWCCEHFKHLIQHHGIAVAAGVFRPRDGKKFFDNIARSFAQSTTIHVELIAACSSAASYGCPPCPENNADAQGHGSVQGHGMKTSR